MHEVTRQIRRFLVSEDGPTAIEYAVMLALVIAVCLLAIDAVGSRVSDSFTNSSNSISSAIGAS
jgi:pilus assembly protein Flp/PilA